jgi:transcriptional regulator with XRE-family HTH domain
MSASHDLNPDRQRLGERITSLRSRAGKSSRKLAEDIGTSHSTIQRLERGESAISFDIVYRVLAVLDQLDLSFRDLGGSDKPPSASRPETP